MKNTILSFVLVAFSFTVNAQQKNEPLEADQNPNYRISQDKYTDSIQKAYTQLQGTTVQNTYKAIDPLEDKRQLRALKRHYRAQRPYWRHQRRLERIKNTRYLQNNDYYSGYNGQFNIGLGNRYNNFHYPRNYRGFNRGIRGNRGYRGFGLNYGFDLLEIGLLAAILLD